MISFAWTKPLKDMPIFIYSSDLAHTLEKYCLKSPNPVCDLDSQIFYIIQFFFKIYFF